MEGGWFWEGLQKIWSNNTFYFGGLQSVQRWGGEVCSKGHGGGKRDNQRISNSRKEAILQNNVSREKK